MLTFNKIIKEIKHVPVDRLEELYEYVHSLTVKNDVSKKKKDHVYFSKILSDMSDEDYQDFVNYTKKVRTRNK